MTTNQVIVQANRVTTEGDDLYNKVRGQGQSFQRQYFFPVTKRKWVGKP